MRNRLRLVALSSLAVLTCVGDVALAKRPFGPDAPATLPDLPPGFLVRRVADGINGATSMTIAPDGRVFVCEQAGALRVVTAEGLQERPVLRVEVDSYWERGLLGVACDPDFAVNGHLYVCYTAREPYTHHRISRFTLEGNVARADSEKILFRGDDQTHLGGAVPAGHQGGGVQIGQDGKLYFSIGEHTEATPSQRLDSLLGKLLRINRDGSIPVDNPFYEQTHGKYRAIWAYGLRNPFLFDFQPTSGRLFINDVGSSLHEEINEGRAGANYGWPHNEGPTDNPDHTGPIYSYSDGASRSIAGGAFYEPPVSQFPARWRGKFLFVDYVQGWVKALDPKRPSDTPLTFASGLRGPVDLRTAPDGSLYLLSRNFWVKKDLTIESTGALDQITYAGAATAAPRIVSQSTDRVVAPGAWLTLSVDVSSNADSYQWARDGRKLRGANSAQLELADIRRDASGVYRCVVSTKRGVLKSAPIRVEIADLHEPLAPREAHESSPGLRSARYECDTQVLPDFDTLQPRTVDVVESLAGLRSTEHTGEVVEGDFLAPVDGVYEFHVASHGIAKLFVAGREVATAAATDGELVNRVGAIGLAAGRHALQLRAVKSRGAAGPRVLVAIDGGDPRVVCGARVSHSPVESASESFAPARLDVIHRRAVPTTLNLPADVDKLPKKLSLTGVFRSLDTLTPNPGVVPYRVNAPLWSDGAIKHRWAAVPAGETVQRTDDGDWVFPEGSVLVKHFELGDPSPDEPGAGNRHRLETRLMRVDHTGMGWAVTYRWNESQTDALLLGPEGASATVDFELAGQPRSQRWDFPTRDQCMVCHNEPSKFALGLTTGQLNGPLAYEPDSRPTNQLRWWRDAGLFTAPPTDEQLAEAPRLTALHDEHAPLADRVRSYLDSNCAMCHRPGGARAEFDARYSTPLAQQGLIHGKLRAGATLSIGNVTVNLGLEDPRIVKPGAPQASMLLQRIARRNSVLQMPPLASREVDPAAIDAITRWIEQLESDSADYEPAGQ